MGKMIKVMLDRFSKRIVHVDFKWYKNEPRLGIYLDVHVLRPILDKNRQAIPLTDDFNSGGFKSEEKSIQAFGFTSPEKVARDNNLEFVNLFILNNILHGKGQTIQKQYYNNLVRFIKTLGLDLQKVNASNIAGWEETLRSHLIGKMLSSYWAQWWNGIYPYVGVDGDGDMKIE